MAYLGVQDRFQINMHTMIKNDRNAISAIALETQ